MPAYLCIALGSATKDSLMEAAQGVFVKVMVAADAPTALKAFAQEQGHEGRYAVASASSLTTSVASTSKTLTVTPDP